MHRHEPLLDVRSGPHFCRTSEQNPHIAGANLGKQCGLFCFGIGVVDELNFAFRHPGGNQFFANIIVDVEVAIVFRCREVAEQKLCQFLFLAIFPNLQNVPNTGVQLTVGVIRQHGIHQADIQTDFPAIIRDAEHIVLGRIHRTGMDFGGAFAQLLHHFFLNLGRFRYHGFKLCIRHWQMKLVRGFDVGNFFEHRHQLREVEELGKSCPRPIARTLRGKFDGGSGFTKSRCPRIKMGQILLLERAVLQIPHNRVQFGHGIADRGSRCEHHAAPACDFVQIAAFAEHIARFLCFAGG